MYDVMLTLSFQIVSAYIAKISKFVK